MSMQPDAQAAVAQQAVSDANDAQWVRLELDFMQLADSGSLDFVRVGADGSRERLTWKIMAFLPFEDLQQAMADEHGSWISSRLVIDRSGRFDYTFNYEDERSWPDGSEVQAESWLAHLQEFPRPWDEIPEWHPAKQKYTEETWAAETRKF